MTERQAKYAFCILAPLWLAFMLSVHGCATFKPPEPEVWNFPKSGFSVVYAPPGNVKCNGEVKPCCWKPASREIWVAWGQWWCMVEELCHREWGDPDHLGPCRRERMP